MKIFDSMKRIIFALGFILFALVANAGGIKTAEDLVGFAKAINEGLATDQWRNEQGEVLLEADIDMSKVKKWEPIKSFGGVFDGQGYSVKNWKSKNGLFDQLLDGGVIRNLIIAESCSLKAISPNEEYHLGFIVNRNDGHIEKCVNYGLVSHKSTYSTYKIFVGGLVGCNRGVIIDCKNFGPVSSNCVSAVQQAGMDLCVGGVAGGGNRRPQKNSSILRSENHGDITYEGDFPWVFGGGIIGNAMSAPIKYCVNRGDVKMIALTGAENLKGRASHVGGVCGAVSSALTGCDNFGKVSSSGTNMGICGGIVGKPRGYITISDCINYGIVTLSNETPSHLGGIAGSCNTPVHFSLCENNGSVKFDGYSPDSPSYVGGIVGEILTRKEKNGAYLRNCLNSGKVTSGSGGNNYENEKCILTGGIIGGSYGTEIAEVIVNGCINTGEVSSVTGRSGQIFGGSRRTKVTGAYYDSYAKSVSPQSDGSNIYGKVVSADGRPLNGVVVTDGHQCVITADDGTYSMISDLTTTRFVYISLPSGYDAEVINSVPQFFKRVRRYENAVSADFVLTESAPQDEYTLVMIGDPQIPGFNIDNSAEQFRDHVITDINTLKETDKGLYAISVGDVIYNDIPGYDAYTDACSAASFPIFNTIGNHDLDPASCCHTNLSVTNFENHVSPTNYSFNIGNVHYIILNTMPFVQEKSSEGYSIGISDECLDWFKSDLDHVSKDRTIVICGHYLLFDPWKRVTRWKNATRMLELLEPYEKVTAWAGHTHSNFGGKFKWKDCTIDAIKVARCNGATRTNREYTNDGTPNGYMVVDVKGGELTWYYKSVNKDKSHQMRVYSPEVTRDGYVKANIWNYTKDYWSAPEWYENGVKVATMEKFCEEDPVYVELFSSLKEGLSGRTLSYTEPIKSEYMFRIKPTPGVRKGEVRVTDNFGVTYTQEVEW